MLSPLALAVLVGTAHAGSATTEVGTIRKLGIGGSTGNGFISAAGKYWLTPSVGFTGYVGNGAALQQIRANFEMDIFTIRDTDFGRFDLYWLAGLDAGVWLFPGFAAGKLGFGAGLGVTLKFNDSPLDAFVDVGLGGFPIDWCASSVDLFCYLQPRADAGVRYYFP